MVSKKPLLKFYAEQKRIAPLNSQSIISELEAERNRLDEAIEALQGIGGAQRGRIGAKGGRRRRHLSSAARKRISAAMRARWAKRKKMA